MREEIIKCNVCKIEIMQDFCFSNIEISVTEARSTINITYDVEDLCRGCFNEFLDRIDKEILNKLEGVCRE